MAGAKSNTPWIVGGAVVVIVVAVCAVVIVRSTRDQATTTSVESTSTTTSGVPTTDREDTVPTTEPPEVDEERLSVRIGGSDRSYLVITPKDLSRGERLPVVVAMHGLGIDSAAMSRAADWRQAVEDDRFIAVFPQGELNSWNVGPCCPPSSWTSVPDVAYLDLVMDGLRSRSDVDPERMYMTGFSNGALMVYAYACARPETFDAIAPMAGSNLTRCFPDQPVRLLHQHSDPDPVVPFDGGLSIGGLLSTRPFPSVPGSVARWAEQAGCDADPTSTTDDDGVEVRQWQGCPRGADVELIRVPDRAHNWPDKGDFVALDAVLEFFELN